MGAPADWTVDASTTYQRWDGFGGTFNEKGWDALSVVSDEIPATLKLLFDPNEGANFVYGRLPLGASDYAMSWYTLDDPPDGQSVNDYSMANFSIARDEKMLIPYIKAALQIRPDIHLWASPWNPPTWMRDSSGNMPEDAKTLTAYALYMAMFVEAYAKDGLTIEAIHPQNEPGYSWAKWPGTVYVDFVKTYLGPTFAQRKVGAAIWCGTMSAVTDSAIATMVASDPQAMMYVKGFGLQWNTMGTVSAVSPMGPVMQTEHRCGNYPFVAPYWDVSEYDASMPQNDHAYGEATWQLIRDWIMAGVNSYCAWNMVLDKVGMSLINWPQNSLLVVDRTAKTVTPTPAYYAFRHYSQYILPGATRIAISNTGDAAVPMNDSGFSNNALAFKNPDGTLVTEVYNPAGSPESTTIAVGGASYRFEVPAHGWATLRVMP
jgi:glucosylceramidase